MGRFVTLQAPRRIPFIKILTVVEARSPGRRPAPVEDARNFMLFHRSPDDITDSREVVERAVDFFAGEGSKHDLWPEFEHFEPGLTYEGAHETQAYSKHFTYLLFNFTEEEEEAVFDTLFGGRGRN